tara:strand:- start:74 stop:358 length:285 start_codon:yes stop_codon:yes gene_type:complete
MAYKYITADNWGKDFFTHEERRKFHLSGYLGNVWVVGNNLYGNAWIEKVSGVSKTKEQAQAIVNAEVLTAQSSWDLESDDYKALYLRPTEVLLP